MAERFPLCALLTSAAVWVRNLLVCARVREPDTGAQGLNRRAALAQQHWLAAARADKTCLSVQTCHSFLRTSPSSSYNNTYHVFSNVGKIWCSILQSKSIFYIRTLWRLVIRL